MTKDVLTTMTLFKILSQASTFSKNNQIITPKQPFLLIPLATPKARQPFQRIQAFRVSLSKGQISIFSCKIKLSLFGRLYQEMGNITALYPPIFDGLFMGFRTNLQETMPTKIFANQKKCLSTTCEIKINF